MMSRIRGQRLNKKFKRLLIEQYIGNSARANLLLHGDTHSTAVTTSSLGVLTTDSETPRVTETTMDTDLLHALEILTKLVIKIVGEELAELTILNVLLTIEEPVGDLVLARVLHDGDDTLKVSLIDLTGTTRIEKEKVSLNVQKRFQNIHTAC